MGTIGWLPFSFFLLDDNLVLMKLNQYIDHTLLKPESTEDEIKKICHEAMEYNFFSVCINPYYVREVKKILRDSQVKVCTVIGFPLGANTTEIKIAETKQALLDGAQEIDMVLNIGELKNKNLTFITNEIKSICEICHSKDAILKVIIETSLLDKDEKVMACKAVSNAGADFIKTSTGFSSAGASIEDVKLLNEKTSARVKVKASGGIRDQATAIAMIEAGASRLGMSSGVAIMQNQSSTESY